MTAAPSAVEKRLRAGLVALDLNFPDATIDQLLAYLELLIKWNRRFNLTAVREPNAMVTRHLLDSLSLWPCLRGTNAADLGSGAGLPGLVLAIAGPEREWVLVDANGKKARFLRAAARELGLTNVTVAEQRVADVAGRFDLITSRAYGSLGDMLASGGKLLAADGVWLAMKGQVPTDELEALPTGFTVQSVTPLAVPDLPAQRHVISLRRVPEPAT